MTSERTLTYRAVRLPIRIKNPTPLLPFTGAFSDGEMGDTYVQYLFLSIYNSRAKLAFINLTFYCMIVAATCQTVKKYSDNS